MALATTIPVPTKFEIPVPLRTLKLRHFGDNSRVGRGWRSGKYRYLKIPEAEKRGLQNMLPPPKKKKINGTRRTFSQLSL